MLKKTLAFTLVMIMIFAFSSCAEKEYSDGGYYLNTMVSITAYGDKCEEAVKAAISEVERLEALLSAYLPQSEISLINAGAAESPVHVSDETARVLKKALEFCRKTNGAFDITVKPLVDLWNIKSENPTVPAQQDIDSALAGVGWQNVTVEGNSVSFASDGVQIGLGGAAKGYCADRAAEVLKSFGIKNALIDLGGNIYALGKNPDGTAWRIGLQDPGAQRGEHFRVEELSDRTAVTSGSYERYFESDGKIYHHILNTQTGYPADSGLISATVIGANSFEADMLSTAVFVLGVSGFDEIKERFDFDRVITVDKSNGVRIIGK